MTILDKIFLLLTGLIAAYMIYFFFKKNGEKKCSCNYYFILSFLVLLIAGVILIFSGFLMLVLPGQGVLAILVGLSITNFPAKFALQRILVEKTGILKAMNWLRKKANKPPLKEPQ